MAQTRPPLNQRLMTHSTRGVPVKIRPGGPPREPKLVKRVISSSFCYCHFKDDLRLRSHREKFNIDILAQIFFEVNIHVEKPGKNFGTKS